MREKRIIGGAEMKEKGEKIAIYSRKSRFTGKGESIGNQVELCKAYLRNAFGENDAAQCIVFEDEGFSGGNINRPAFQNMMAKVRKGNIKAIAVYRLDRISRNISDFAGLIDELTKRDVSFISIREQFDTGTPMGRAMMYIISVFSQLERETIAQRIRDNMLELAKTGRWLGGNTPTGYASESVSNVTLDGKTRKACKLKLIPKEAELVQTVFDLYLRTDSLTAVEAELLRREIKTKRGNDFTRFSIKAILENPVYMIADEEARRYFVQRGVTVHGQAEAFDGSRGIIAYNRTDQEKGKAAVYLPMDEWIVAVGKHPGIIPSGQWIRVQASLERNRSKAYRKPRSNEALLTGILFCACGGRMYPKQRKSLAADTVQRYSYVCKEKERSKRSRCNCANADGNTLDAAVFTQVATLDEDLHSFTDRLEKNRRHIAASQRYEQREDLREELTRSDRKINGLIDAMSLLENAQAKLQVARRIEGLLAAKERLGQRLRETEQTSAEGGTESRDLSKLRQILPDYRACAGEMTLEEKREAIRRVICKVMWDGENAHVFFRGDDEKIPDNCDLEKMPEMK